MRRFEHLPDEILELIAEKLMPLEVACLGAMTRRCYGFYNSQIFLRRYNQQQGSDLDLTCPACGCHCLT